ncbi:MAG: hypothetical protein HYS41_07015 [Candidatus Omnitrophica bacterium]|nr:hypothetical protein [Candidatus Omnitrophota bacterium]
MKRKEMVIAGLGLFLLAACSSPLAWAEPTADELRQTIRDYIARQEQALGTFTVPDPRDGKGMLRTLTLVRVHERVGKTGNYYYSCTDMKDAASGDELDLDFDVSDTDGKLQVVAVRIHKDNGKPRYTYDANDNLVPLS